MQKRLTPEECRKRIDAITEELAEHEGQRVLLIAREGRVRSSRMAVLRREGNRICAEWTEQDRHGRDRGTRRVVVSPVSIHTGELEVVYLDENV